MEERKMKHVLWIKIESLLNVSSSMMHEMSKLLVQFCVQFILKQCVFMEGNIFVLVFQWPIQSQTHTGWYYVLLFILLHCFNVFFTFMLSIATGCITFLGLLPAMEFMHNLLLKPKHFMMENNWFNTRCRNQICYLVLWNAQSATEEASIEGNNSQSIACKS